MLSLALLVAVAVAGLTVGPGRRWLEVRRGQQTLDQLLAEAQAALVAGDAGALTRLARPQAKGAAAAARQLVAQCDEQRARIRIEVDDGFGRDIFLSISCPSSEGMRRLRTVNAVSIDGGGITRWFLAIGTVSGPDIGLP